MSDYEAQAVEKLQRIIAGKPEDDQPATPPDLRTRATEQPPPPAGEEGQ
jgi:hypothetical protein